MCLKHYVPDWHYEKPDRIEKIMIGIKELIKKYPNNIDILEDFARVEEYYLLITHDPNYILRIRNSCPTTDIPEHVTQNIQDSNGNINEQDFDTFMSHHSMDAALIAAGAVCKAIDLVKIYFHIIISYNKSFLGFFRII